jgi:hypothetical protein
MNMKYLAKIRRGVGDFFESSFTGGEVSNMLMNRTGLNVFLVKRNGFRVILQLVIVINDK